MASEFTTRIKGAFFDALYAFLDGMVQLAFSEYSPLEPRTALSVQAVPGQPGSSVDVRDLDTRVLLSVTNLAHLTRSVIPGLVKHFSDAYAVKMDDDLATLAEWRCNSMRSCSTTMCSASRRPLQIISRGILESGIDWASIPKPSGVHSFIYEALLSLVKCTRTCAVSPNHSSRAPSPHS